MKKEKIITIRVSENEYTLILATSKELGLTISSYVRMCALLKSKNNGI